MKKTFKLWIFFLFIIAGHLSAQDLEPRAYVRAPVRLNIVTTGVFTHRAAY